MAGKKQAVAVVAAAAPQTQVERVFLPDVPIEQVSVASNVRKHFDEQALQELADDIKVNGIVQPLVVRPNPDFEAATPSYVLVAGERRLRAAKLAGLTAVPAMVTFLDDRAAARVQLLENIHRVDLDPIEEARAFRALLDDHGYTQAVLAQELGCSQPHVANRLRLLRLPDQVTEEISRGMLSASVAQSLLKWADQPSLVAKAADRLIADKITQEAAPGIVDSVMLASLPMVSAGYSSKTVDPECHKDCPCRRVCKGFYREGEAVCTDPIRFSQVEAEARMRLEQQAEDDTGGPIDVDKLGPEYNSTTYRIFDKHCKGDHAACACLHDGIQYGEPCQVCRDPKAFDKIERAAARAEGAELRKKIKAEQASSAEWAAARVAETWPPDLSQAELAYFAALVVCSVQADYSGPSQSRRANLADYLKGVGVEWTGQVFSYQHAEVAQKMLAVPADVLWRICIEWPLIAEAPDNPRSFGGWYRRTVDGEPQPHSADAIHGTVAELDVLTEEEEADLEDAIAQ